MIFLINQGQVQRYLVIILRHLWSGKDDTANYFEGKIVLEIWKTICNRISSNEEHIWQNLVKMIR